MKQNSYIFSLQYDIKYWYRIEESIASKNLNVESFEI